VRSRAERRTVRRKIRWTRLLLVLFILLVLVMTITGVATYAYITLVDTPAAHGGADASKTADTLNTRINILLLGMDDGNVDKANAPKRTDTIIVASINPQEGTLNLLSIPGDTRVTISSQKGFDKITNAYALGGPQLTKRTVEEFLDIPIDFYIEAQWQGVMKAVDILGGVDLYVERNMNYDDPRANVSIHLTNGYQHLDGQKAGQYVQFRYDELGDIGRVQRQQRFLKALSDELFCFGSIFKLPALTSTLRQYVSTDMPAFSLLKMARTVTRFNDKGIHAELLPGKLTTIDGLKYWVPDREQSRTLVENLFSPVVDARVTGTAPGKTRTN